MRLFLIIGLAIIFSNSLGYGLADWQHITPGGNVMSDPGDGTHLTITKTRQEISGIVKWYFYRNFIIGQIGRDSYFIVNEIDGEVFSYKNRNEWIDYISANDLTPPTWTRWYTDNWVDGDIFYIWLVLLFYISIPFILFFLFALYKVVTKERFRITGPYTIFVLTTVTIIGSTLMLDHYPQSF
jgi:hypothetical protein